MRRHLYSVHREKSGNWKCRRNFTNGLICSSIVSRSHSHSHFHAWLLIYRMLRMFILTAGFGKCVERTTWKWSFEKWKIEKNHCWMGVQCICMMQLSKLIKQTMYKLTPNQIQFPDLQRETKKTKRKMIKSGFVEFQEKSEGSTWCTNDFAARRMNEHFEEKTFIWSASTNSKVTAAVRKPSFFKVSTIFFAFSYFLIVIFFFEFAFNAIYF